jgi:hypothetical protein
MKSTYVCALVVRLTTASEAAALAHNDPFGNLKDAVLPTTLAALSCTELLHSYQTLECPFAAADSDSGPPRLMPQELTAAYTMNGTVPTAAFFVDDSNSSHVRHYRMPHPRTCVSLRQSIPDCNIASDYHSLSAWCVQGTYYRYSSDIIDQYVQAARINNVRVRVHVWERQMIFLSPRHGSALRLSVYSRTARADEADGPLAVLSAGCVPCQRCV